VVVAAAAVALLGWQAVTTVARDGVLDTPEHMRYAAYLDEHHRIPSKDENYEYSTPPLFHLVAIAVQHVVGWVHAPGLELRSNTLTRLLWLALVAAGAAAMTATRRGVRIGGICALGAALLWGLNEAVALGRTLPWSAGQFVSLAAFFGLLWLTALIALEVWPARRGRAAGAVALMLAYPVVFRMGVLFHPEMLFAFSCCLALWLALRSARRGWPPALGAATGLACAAAALTRASAVVVMACVLGAALLAGGRAALGYAAACAVAIVLVAGPWWGYAYHLWGNPLQSNLEREGQMLDRQPRSFYISFPAGSLVVHPYRPDFQNELLPKLHADLWSDWFGAFHDFWAGPSRLARATASSQSVLGFAGDLLALGGLFVLGVPAAVRVVRRRGAREPDLGLGLLAATCVLGFAAFLLTLVRFPQIEGDPIKSSYLLFTAPGWAVISVAAWCELRRRSAPLGAVALGVAGLYAVSYALSLGAALA
jgi:4-amino-4-deoxy-L-arabinose transferase-like glycosyltransferase